MNKHAADPQETLEQEITRKVRSGEYFTEALRWYHASVHTPIVHRAYLVIITALCLATLWFGLGALTGILPLHPQVPFIWRTSDPVELTPRIQRLAQPGEDKRLALVRFLVLDYVQRREEYLVENLEKNVRRVRALSDQNTFVQYWEYLDRRNPASPIVRFKTHTARLITLRTYRMLEDGHSYVEDSDEDKAIKYAKPRQYRVRVRFTASAVTGTESVPTEWEADISFVYAHLEVNQATQEVTPMQFVVTAYTVKQL